MLLVCADGLTVTGSRPAVCRWMPSTGHGCRDATLARLPAQLMIDHNGKFLESVQPDHAGFRSLLRLLDSGRCWVKLLAPYQTSRSGPPNYDDVSVLAHALVQAKLLGSGLLFAVLAGANRGFGCTALRLFRRGGDRGGGCRAA